MWNGENRKKVYQFLFTLKCTILSDLMKHFERVNNVLHFRRNIVYVTAVTDVTDKL